MRRDIASVCLLVAASGGAGGQHPFDKPAGVVRLASGVAARRAVGDGSDGSSDSAPAVAWPEIRSRVQSGAREFPPIASALVPGSGQLILGQGRAVGYAAFEVWYLLRWRNDREDQSRSESRFRSLARDVARLHFATDRPDGDWAYYEHMRDYLESGFYSLVEGQVVPDTSSTTYNGFLWKSVRAHNPDSASALVEYERRAVKPEFRWSWRSAQLEWDQYQRTTSQRNDAAAKVAFDLTLLGLNHIVSMVDAFASVRLRVEPRPGGGLDIGGSLPAGAFLTGGRTAPDRDK